MGWIITRKPENGDEQVYCLTEKTIFQDRVVGRGRWLRWEDSGAPNEPMQYQEFDYAKTKMFILKERAPQYEYLVCEYDR